MTRWGRLYGGTYNHRKIVMLREKFPSDWRSWYVLIDLAIEVDDDGWIYVSPGVPYDLSMLCRILGIKRAITLQSFLNYLSIIDLITVNDKGILLLGFGDRNYLSDCSTPRVQKYREKLIGETLPKRSSNVSETTMKRTIDRDRNRDIDRTEKETPLPPSRGNGYTDDFSKWWSEYPNRRKSGKPKVFKKWQQLKKAGELPELPEMISTLEKQKKSADWIKDAGEFIPGPFPYLNQSKFLDESIQPSREPPPIIRNPSCPRCHGKGLYQSGTMPDGSPAFLNCKCEKQNDHTAN
jgi:hypothetical protein